MIFFSCGIRYPKYEPIAMGSRSSKPHAEQKELQSPALEGMAMPEACVPPLPPCPALWNGALSRKASRKECQLENCAVLIQKAWASLSLALSLSSPPLALEANWKLYSQAGLHIKLAPPWGILFNCSELQCFHYMEIIMHMSHGCYKKWLW